MSCKFQFLLFVVMFIAFVDYACAEMCRAYAPLDWCVLSRSLTNLINSGFDSVWMARVIEVDAKSDRDVIF